VHERARPHHLNICLPLTALAKIGVEQLTALASLFAIAAPDAKAAARYPSEDPFFDTEAIREAMRVCGGPPLPAWSTIGVYAIQTLRLKRGKSPAKPKIVNARVKKNGRRLLLRAAEPIVAFVAPTTAPGTALPPMDAPWDRIQSEALRQGFELRAEIALRLADVQSHSNCSW
jgi:hypothetical protein